MYIYYALNFHCDIIITFLNLSFINVLLIKSDYIKDVLFKNIIEIKIKRKNVIWNLCNNLLQNYK